MSKAEEISTAEGGSATAPLEARYKLLFRYFKLGLVALLITGVLSSVTFWQVNQEKEVAVSNQQVQADTALNSDFCKIYPATDYCVISKEIKENPTQAVIPKDGKDGQDGQDGADGNEGPAGRGVTTFDKSSGSLIVTYTDGQTQDLGVIVGQDGKDGADGATGAAGADGRGIVSSDIASGSLMVTYTDGTVQNAGIVVGPKGDTGDTGAAGRDGIDGQPGRDGQDGQPGTPGLTPTSVNSDLFGNVTVTYNDGSTAQAGQIILPNIEIFTCENNVMTLKLTNGPAHTAPAVCSLSSAIPPINPSPNQ
jgi:hypothetical protein